MSAERDEFWPSDATSVRLAPLKAAFREAASITYRREAAGEDFWQSCVETRRRQSGDCEDIREVFERAVLESFGLAKTEAIRLAIVDSGTRVLEPRAQLVDDWGEVLVPGVDHACCLWLPDVEPTLSSAAYAVRWGASREIAIDPTWKVVAPWNDVGFTLVWSWGLEGERGVWRKHFKRKPA